MDNYDDYLNSSAWKLLKESKLREQPTCECCDLRNADTVHHLSYKRLGCEDSNDVVSICHICHHECHFHENIKISLLEGILRDRFKEVKERYRKQALEKLITASHKEQKIREAGIDARSFKILGQDPFMEYAKDNNHVYKRDLRSGEWKAIQQADINTFGLRGGRFQDRKYIYFGQGNVKEKLSTSRKMILTVFSLLFGLGLFAIGLIFPPLIIATVIIPYSVYMIWTDQD